MGEAAFVEMTVVRVSPYLREDRPLLWLGEKDSEVPRLLPIAIGEFEAAAIQMPLEGEQPMRPISYDLLASMLDRVGVAISRIVIESVHKSVFFAKVVVQDQEQVRSIDSRPSDAVALALRTSAPIFASRALLDEVALEPGEHDGDMERFLERFHEMEPQIIQGQKRKTPCESGELVATVSAGAPRASAACGELSLLHSRLQQAVICEEYEEAARLRDQIQSLQKPHAE